MDKKNIIVLFGGQSSEHEVSLVSATTILHGIDKEKYKIYPVGITKDGQWRYFDGSWEKIATGEWVQESNKAILSPDASDQSLFVFNEEGLDTIDIDVVFPALHGLFGEDGTIQGLLELARIPYVGCGVLASSVAMDKLYTKKIVEDLGIRQAKCRGVLGHELKHMDLLVEEIEHDFSYPVFIKPSNAGSSVGVTKAHNRGELINGLLDAVKHDRKILVEETIVGREVECGVLGNDHVKASGVGEILAAEEFYSYDAKYNNDASETILDAELPDSVKQEIRNSSIAIFQAIDGRGFARVDFFVENETGEVVFNEINTLPGFTSISMYPMLWAEQGMNTKELVARLIELAME